MTLTWPSHWTESITGPAFLNEVKEVQYYNIPFKKKQGTYVQRNISLQIRYFYLKNSLVVMLKVFPLQFISSEDVTLCHSSGPKLSNLMLLPNCHLEPSALKTSLMQEREYLKSFKVCAYKPPLHEGNELFLTSPCNWLNNSQDNSRISHPGFKTEESK